MFIGLAVLAVSLLATLPTPAGAQQGEVEVRVRDEASGQPLAGARVQLAGSAVGGVTDERGVFRLRSLSAGKYTVDVVLAGFGPGSASTQVVVGAVDTLDFRLVRGPVAVDPVEVETRRRALVQHGFFERMASGHGTFFTRQEIEEMRPRYLSDVLRRAGGVSLVPTRTGARATSRGSPRDCSIQYYLNGILAPYFDVDQILPGDVEGLEVYRGAATIPPAFNRGTAICGVILIWTRIG